jgi:hypothetical protein
MMFLLQRILPAYARVKQSRVPNAYDKTALRLEVCIQIILPWVADPQFILCGTTSTRSGSSIFQKHLDPDFDVKNTKGFFYKK